MSFGISTKEMAMFTRMLALAIVLVFVIEGSSAKVNAADGSDRLRKLLEEKFGNVAPPNARSVAPAESKTKEDLYIVKPDGTVEKLMRSDKDTSPKPEGENPTKPARDDQSSLPPPRLRKATMFMLGSGVTLKSPAPPTTIIKTGMTGRYVSTPAPSPAVNPARKKLIQLQSKKPAMVVNRRQIVIQLKPSATGQQIDDLIRKYDLKIIKHVSFLGVLYVEHKQASKTRTPPGKKVTLGSLLEPPIIKKLRAEGAVNAAFVSTTISPKTIPHASGPSIRTRSGNKIKWDWVTGEKDDGNWGLKKMRMPAVWTILSRFRKAHAGQAGHKRTRVAILDTGFGTHPQLTFKNIKDRLPPRPIAGNCVLSHGTHVAGIIAASQDVKDGIEGIVPDTEIDPIPISRDLVTESAIEGTGVAQQHLSYFMDAITDLGRYFQDFPLQPDERAVINISLAYNWSGVAMLTNEDPTTDRVIRDQIRQHANVVQFLVDPISSQVVFVVAAGNDSEGLEKPVSAELATPFAFAATHRSVGFTPSKNIIVVEAHDRAGRRAGFSNVGGHVSAPGVDVLSTLASETDPYGVCSGTSQAAPHVAALAALLLELDPSKTPAQIVKIITSSAKTGTEDGGAPRVDALAAVLSLSNKNLKILADLNGDNKVDSQDMDVFRSDLITLEGGRFGGWIRKDLNGDGIVDKFERCWPVIDLNGSGRASYDPEDARMVGGSMLSDLEVLKAAWTDPVKSYAVALRENRLGELINVWRSTALVAAVPRLGEIPACQ